MDDVAHVPSQAAPGRLRRTVGFYTDQVLPRAQDVLMGRKPLREVRARVCSGLRGDVVEVGFGTGLNSPYYPSEVTTLYAVEPSQASMRMARPRVERNTVPMEPAGLSGERLDLPSERFDAALSTWTLCTIPDVGAALAELHRVLKPGATFHFVEHGHAPDPGVARWQERIEPIWKPIAGGCHLTRRMPELIDQADFTIDNLDTYYFKGELKPFGYTYEGRAHKD
jgi:ubiquinone/menaquinone biosynthesis C-methylase UbiE